MRVAAEYERPVPPLDLPHDDAGVEDVARSGAVRLFVEQARRVRPDFTLTGENTTDVAEICRRLDGLPLAIELAAGRIKLLSPHALLTRLDKALDLKASGVGRPTRQQTLRDTIAWSYDLLTPLQQAVFRRLGVFAGGADLDAIAAVCDDLLDGDDPLDVVGELVDASLATVIEEAQEPRIGMLVTVRAYAYDQLQADGELAAVQRRHANYFCAVADDMWSLRHGPQQQVAQQRIETELDNLREVLAWALGSGTGAEPDPERVALGERLCQTFAWVWLGGGYFEEARHWLERCIGLPREAPDLVHVENLARLGHIVSIQGDFIRSRELAEASIDIARGFGDSRELVVGLAVLAVACWDTGDIEGARRAFEEGHAMVRRVADRSLTAVLLTDIAYFESEQGNHDRSQQLIAEVLEICVDIGDTEFATLAELSMITSLFKTGNVAEAHLRSQDAIDPVLTCRDPFMLIGFARSHADILFETGDLDAAVRLLGSAAVMQERIGIKDPPAAEAQVQGLLLRCQVAMAAVDFQRAYQAGQAIMVEDLLVEMKDH
ncbi:MAG: hypothetical protein H0V23_05160 [Nocardioidaceae bacterium]|nr:hypothetical protein [Nocardioidaceae bacterium]